MIPAAGATGSPPHFTWDPGGCGCWGAPQEENPYYNSSLFTHHSWRYLHTVGGWVLSRKLWDVATLVILTSFETMGSPQPYSQVPDLRHLSYLASTRLSKAMRGVRATGANAAALPPLSALGFLAVTSQHLRVLTSLQQTTLFLEILASHPHTQTPAESRHLVSDVTIPA